MYRQLAATGGIPYEMEMNVKMSGEGPMAGDVREDGQHLDRPPPSRRWKPARSPRTCSRAPAGYKIKEQK